MPNKADLLWVEILSVLKKEITAQSFETWLKPLNAVELTDDVFTIAVPNKFFKEWLNDHYAQSIRKTAGLINKTNLRVDFIVSAESNNPVPEKLFTQTPSENFISRSSHKTDIYLNPKYTFDSFVIGEQSLCPRGQRGSCRISGSSLQSFIYLWRSWFRENTFNAGCRSLYSGEKFRRETFLYN